MGRQDGACVKPDLYQALGVERNAKSDEIRRAYRKAAKRAHPDGGGTVESFALVRTAVDVLSDDERRKQYDETGEFGDKPVDNLDALAMTVAMNAVDAVVGAIIKQGGDPAHYDVVDNAKMHLKKCITEIEQKVDDTLAEAKAIRKLAKRFRPKKGKPNHIGAMLDARAAETERNAEKGKSEKENVEGALKILNDHMFDVETAQQFAQMGGAAFNFFASGIR
jgi:curved DNA-binding protein CbpA